jgi:uncharacterized protein (TIGR00730 family)
MPYTSSMARIQAVTVFCSSSSAIAPEFQSAARELGSAIAAQGWRLVYGGNFVGLMAAIAEGCRAAGGKVTGITPQLMVDKGLSDRHADELVVTNDMRDRKALLEVRGDAFVALPGGLGTYEEVFECIVGRQLGYHDKPIVLLNIGDYYRPMLEMVRHGIEHKFIKNAALDLFFVAPNVEEAIEYLKKDVKRVVVDKWFDKSF